MGQGFFRKFAFWEQERPVLGCGRTASNAFIWSFDRTCPGPQAAVHRVPCRALVGFLRANFRAGGSSICQKCSEYLGHWHGLVGVMNVLGSEFILHHWKMKFILESARLSLHITRLEEDAQNLLTGARAVCTAVSGTTAFGWESYDTCIHFGGGP